MSKQLIEALEALIGAVEWRAAVFGANSDAKKKLFADEQVWFAVDAAKAALSRPAEGDGWISVEERLPPESGEYWTYSPTSYFKQQQSDWIADAASWHHEWVRKKRSEPRPRTWITHWRPLPPPPTAGSGEKG